MQPKQTSDGYFCVLHVIFTARRYALRGLDYSNSVRPSGASIPIYRWRQMRHGQFWGERKINFLWGNEKV